MIEDTRSSTADDNVIDLWDVPLAAVPDHLRNQLRLVKGWCAFKRMEEDEPATA